MSIAPRSIVCDRVRAQISLRLDGELSELESRMLESHVARCAGCSEFETAVSTLTTRLRSAPLEPVPHPIVVRRPRRAVAARLQIGAAAALAVAVLGALTQVAPQSEEQAFATPKRYATYDQLSREIKQIIRDGEAFSQRRGHVMPL